MRTAWQAADRQVGDTGVHTAKRFHSRCMDLFCKVQDGQEGKNKQR